MIDRKSLVVAIGIITLACVLPASGSDAKMTAEELVARHLGSIGTAEARGAVKTRVVQGGLHFRITTGAFADRKGNATVVSEDKQIRMVLRYSDPKWVGENLLTDGNRVQAYGSPRSAFGEFIFSQSPILRDGLLGGVLSTAWPFLHPGAHPAKLSYNGLKKIDGRELHELRYVPKKGPSDAEIKLYFEPETYHHAMTIYTLTISPRMALRESQTARQQEIRIRVEERFDDFRSVDGLMLPTMWKIYFAQEGETGSGMSRPATETDFSGGNLEGRGNDMYRNVTSETETHFTRLENNVPLDPKNFAFK